MFGFIIKPLLRKEFINNAIYKYKFAGLLRYGFLFIRPIIRPSQWN